MTQQSRPFQISKDDLVSGFLLEKTAKLMKLHFSRMLLLHPEIDITVDQWIILDLLHSGEKINQQKLAELAFKDAPTVTRILDILEQKKYIARKTDKGDRRKFDISLLAKGQKLYENVWPIAREFREDCYESLTNEEMITFKKVLLKINHKLSTTP